MDVNCEAAPCVQVFDHDEWSRRQADVEFLSRSGAVSEALAVPSSSGESAVSPRLSSPMAACHTEALCSSSWWWYLIDDLTLCCFFH